MLKAAPLSISRSRYSLCRGREKVWRGGGEIVVGEVQREEVGCGGWGEASQDEGGLERREFAPLKDNCISQVV